MGKWFLELMMLQTELNVRDYSKRTIDLYKKVTEEFLDFVNKSPEEIEKEDVEAYLEHQVEIKGLSKNTVMLRFNAIEFFLVKVLGLGITETIEKFNREYKDKELISEKEFINFLGCNITERNRAMYCLAYFMGLSAEEISDLNINDYDSPILKIEKRQEDLEIKENIVIDALNKWIDKRGYLIGIMTEEALFINNDYKRLNQRSIGRWFQLDCDENRVNKKVTFKTLKYSRAYELVQKGHDEEAKKLLGYRTMDRVYRYFREIGYELKK